MEYSDGPDHTGSSGGERHGPTGSILGI